MYNYAARLISLIKQWELYPTKFVEMGDAFSGKCATDGSHLNQNMQYVNLTNFICPFILHIFLFEGQIKRQKTAIYRPL